MNFSEERFKKELESAGWTVFHHGIPDFICFKDGKLAFIEYKSRSVRGTEHEFTEHQQKTFEMLEALGFPVHIIYSDQELVDMEGNEIYEAELESFVKELEEAVDQPKLKDHVFFKSIGDYGQIIIPAGLRQKLGFFKKEIYAMVIVIPVVTQDSSLTRDEAYEYLKFLTS